MLSILKATTGTCQTCQVIFTPTIDSFLTSRRRQQKLWGETEAGRLLTSPGQGCIRQKTYYCPLLRHRSLCRLPKGTLTVLVPNFDVLSIELLAATAPYTRTEADKRLQDFA